MKTLAELNKIAELIKATKTTDGRVYLTDDDGRYFETVYKNVNDFIFNTIVGKGSDFDMQVKNGKVCVYIPD